MSIFAGIVTSNDNRPEFGTAKSMLSCVVAPNHQRIDEYRDDAIDIACRSSNGDDSFYSNDNIIVVSDGKLTATGELCARLGLAKTERNLSKILAVAYAKWQGSLVENISGAFAFAIWNKNSRTLFCARDRFGTIPLSFRPTATGLLFASDFISTASYQASAIEINDSWIIEYLMGVSADATTTPFQGSVRLRPGHAMTWCDRKLRFTEYWSFAEVGPVSEISCEADLCDALEQSIDDRITGEQCATMLSGGLDSSSLAILARDSYRKRWGRSINSISLISDDNSHKSDNPYIHSVLEQGGFSPNLVHIDEYNALTEIDRFVRLQGAPNDARGAPVLDQALRKASELGFSTVIDGHGGDETVSSFGVMRLFELARDNKWSVLFVELLLVSRNSNLKAVRNFLGLHSTRGSGLAAKVSRKLYLMLKGHEITSDEIPLLHSDWAAHPSVEVSHALKKGQNPSRYDNERVFQESVLAAPLQSQAHEYLYRQYRSHGLKPAIPFWDERVIERCLRAPSRLKLKRGVPRSLIRSMMGDRLPDPVSRRTTKYDFSNYVVRSLNSSMDDIREIALSRNHSVFDYVDNRQFVKAIENTQSQNLSTKLEATSKLWRALNLYAWLELVTRLKSTGNEPEGYKW